MLRAITHPETVEEYFFKMLLNSRLTETGLEYRVQWGGRHLPTWEPAENLAENTSDIVDFREANPSKPGPPSWFAAVGPPKARSPGP